MKSTVFHCLLLGLCSLPCIAPKYVLVEVEDNWSGAEKYCRENYKDLVTFDHPEQMKMVFEFFRFYYTGSVWIGLYNDIDSWQWSTTTQNASVWNTTFSNWKLGEPNNKNGNESCAGMSVLTGKWNDISCESRFFFICYDLITNNSDASHNQKIYALIHQEKTWRDAEIYCRKNYIDLVTVSNQAENDYIYTEILQNLTTDFVWIGLFRETWKWSDRSNSSFRYWAHGQPDNYYGNENCAVALFTDPEYGKWSDVQCDLILPFLCYNGLEDTFSSVSPISIEKRTVVKVKISTNGELTSPVFSKEVLEHLRKEFINQGMSNDTILHWRTQPDGQIFHRKEDYGETKGACKS